MRRRDFIKIAAAATSPFAARAEPSGPLRRVGVLIGLAAGPDVPVAKAFLAPFQGDRIEASRRLHDGHFPCVRYPT